MQSISPYVFPGVRVPVADRSNIRHEKPAKPTRQLQRIMAIVCTYYEVDARVVRSPARYRTPTLARQMFTYLTLRHTRITMVQIGNFLGMRDHTTVVHSRKTIENALAYNEDIQRDLLLLQAQLRNIF